MRLIRFKKIVKTLCLSLSIYLSSPIGSVCHPTHLSGSAQSPALDKRRAAEERLLNGADHSPAWSRQVYALVAKRVHAARRDLKVWGGCVGLDRRCTKGNQ
jgi:hypothetical protein